MEVEGVTYRRLNERLRVGTGLYPTGQWGKAGGIPVDGVSCNDSTKVRKVKLESIGPKKGKRQKEKSDGIEKYGSKYKENVNICGQT